MVAQNYADEDATWIATKSTTIQLFSQRISVSLATLVKVMRAYPRKILESYVEFHTRL